MLALPLPLFVSLVLGFLAVRLAVRDRSISMTVLLLLALGMQSVIIALVQHYGVQLLRPVQPITGAIMPPVAWLTFLRVNRRPLALSRDWPHLLAPLFIAFCTVMAPDAVDPALVVAFILYGVLMLLATREGADDLPMARLDAGDWPLHVWRMLAGMLILSGLSDIGIAIAYAMGMPFIKFYVLDVVATLLLMAIGLLGMMQPAATAPADADDADPVRMSPPDPNADRDLVQRLDALLTQSALYREPDLTLARLARRLNVPAKQLSAAINRHCGESVSRYVNSYRIREASARIAGGQSITMAMLDSGFNTKSNFNREFLRVTGMAPSAWREQQPPAPAFVG